MVFKKSVYRKQYRDPVWDSHFPHYQAKVDYRIHRRRLEHHHQIFDWDWDSESGNSEEDRRGRTRTAPNLNNNSQERPGGRGQERGKEDREVQTPEWSKMRGVQPRGASEPIVGGDLESSPRLNGERMLDINEEHHRDSKQAQLTRKHRKASKHPSRDKRQARPSTSPEKSSDRKKRQADHPPMVAYGWADRELTTGCKKTHNIRASADPLQIYPSALRAMRRRELDIQRQAEKGRQHNLQEQKLKAMFNMQPRDDSVWLTEYRRNFAGPSQPR